MLDRILIKRKGDRSEEKAILIMPGIQFCGLKMGGQAHRCDINLNFEIALSAVFFIIFTKNFMQNVKKLLLILAINSHDTESDKGQKSEQVSLQECYMTEKGYLAFKLFTPVTSHSNHLNCMVIVTMSPGKGM